MDTKLLSPALLRLMEACVVLKTTNAKTLAIHLQLSPSTVRTEFQRILAIMDVHCRYSALKSAEELGWVSGAVRANSEVVTKELH